MIQDVQALLDRYSDWLRDRTSLREAGDWIEITTPYLDRHNDYLQIYARRPNGDPNGDFILTDDGYILDDLEQSGCSLDTPKRQGLFQTTLNGFGVQTVGGTLQVRASADDFALRKHNLVQAMLAVNDLFCLATPTVASLFHEDVAAWLDLSQIRYTPTVTFTGKSGYGHRFDFVIPKSTEKPERVLRAINSPDRNASQMMVFAWLDTKEARSPESRAYAVLNDSKRPVPATVLDALRSYDVRPIPWSARDEIHEGLAT